MVLRHQVHVLKSPGEEANPQAAAIKFSDICLPVSIAKLPLATSAGDDPSPFAPSLSSGLRLKRNLMGVGYLLLSGFIVATVGMSTLYYDAYVFGTVADYAGVLRWGAAAQTGVNLIRRLSPNFLKNLPGP